MSQTTISIDSMELSKVDELTGLMHLEKGVKIPRGKSVMLAVDNEIKRLKNKFKLN